MKRLEASDLIEVDRIVQDFQYIERFENMTEGEYAELDMYGRRNFQMYLALRQYTEDVTGILTDERRTYRVLKMLEPERREGVLAENVRTGETLFFHDSKEAGLHFSETATKIARVIRYKHTLDDYIFYRVKQVKRYNDKDWQNEEKK